MQSADFYKTLNIDKSPVEALGFNPYYQELCGLRLGQTRISLQSYFDLASNDYLGLASDSRIQEAMIGAIQEYGSSMCGTPVATGHTTIMAELERRLARFTGLEAALVFPSCYQANMALFPAIVTEADVVIVDHYAHASLAHGIKGCGSKIKPFLHNNMEHLEKQLASSRQFRQIFVVTESVFSTEGSVAPLDSVVELCQRYDAIPIVDDSHGLGVLGETGRGILESKKISQYPGIYTASLGKALANSGGMIAGPRALIDWLRYSCPGLIFSTALPPACVGGLLRTLDIIEREFGGIRKNLWNNHCRLLAKLHGLGFEVQSAEAPIAAIRCGSLKNTLLIAKKFFEHRILVTPFVPPSVPPESGVARLIVGAKLDCSGMLDLMKALEQLHPPFKR